MIRIIVREQEDGSFVADRPWLSGMCIVGRGLTWKESLGDLLLQCSFEELGPFEGPPIIYHKDGTPFNFNMVRGRSRRD